MPAKFSDSSIQVVIGEDHSSAELVIPPQLPREAIKLEVCLNHLREAGVDVRDETIKAVTDMLAAQRPPGGEWRAVVATGTLPEQGRDGSVRWTVDRTRQKSELKSHYERSAFIVVKPGDVLGRIIEPTEGKGGRDVLGRSIPAKAGKPATLQLDKTIHKDETSRLIARGDGVLIRERHRAYVQPVIKVPEYVDFSIGNIDFEGDTVIQKGIRDRFVVKCRGSVDVHGLIEAATIQCGGNLTARGGMAARGRGSINVGGDVIARYLDKTQGEIRGDLNVDREVINCHLLVHGKVDSPRAAIIGGRITVIGPVKIGTLGSPAGIPTQLALGTVLLVEAKAAQLEDLLAKLNAKRKALLAQARELRTELKSLSPAEKQRLAELTDEVQTTTDKLTHGRKAHQEMLMRATELQTADLTVDLTVLHMLNCGTVLHIRGQSFKISDGLPGPVKMCRDENGIIVYHASYGSGPLSDIAQLQTNAA